MAERKRQEPSEETDPQAMAEAVAEAREAMEAPVEGGRYKTADGRLVNAQGEEIDAKGTVKKTDD